MGLTDEDVREILRIIDESELDELRIETPDFRLHVRRGGAPLPAEAPPPPAPREAPTGGSDGAATPEAREPGAEAAPPAAPEASANGAATIDAPMLGTFYRASAPGEEPFVDVGSEVEPDTVVCLIEEIGRAHV